MSKKVELKKFPEHGFEIRYSGRALYHHITNQVLYDAYILARHKKLLNEFELSQTIYAEDMTNEQLRDIYAALYEEWDELHDKILSIREELESRGETV